MVEPLSSQRAEEHGRFIRRIANYAIYQEGRKYVVRSQVTHALLAETNSEEKAEVWCLRRLGYSI